LSQRRDSLHLVLIGNLEVADQFLYILAGDPCHHPEYLEEVVPHRLQAQWVLAFNVLQILVVLRKVLDNRIGVPVDEVIDLLECSDL
jgi:hypothetical protein